MQHGYTLFKSKQPSPFVDIELQLIQTKGGSIMGLYTRIGCQQKCRKLIIQLKWIRWYIRADSSKSIPAMRKVLIQYIARNQMWGLYPCYTSLPMTILRKKSHWTTNSNFIFLSWAPFLFA
eukprot:TRINITY_DN4359_c0_g1_i15.p1 TRINITY_DN4359_c0_g1~~TRINITY_DN4359_c0_g1_i15.p1  ORF type:complete len:121 (-),score=0.08 TRINITY_DN4359_c0_g1_i15:1281-1643(-)